MSENKQVTKSSFMNKAILNFNIIKNYKKDSKNNLLEEVKSAIDELENVRQYFNSVNEPELIDYAIYREKAAITRLSYLLRIAKDEK
ncbi:MAG: YaaL family protein [Caloramator sp.]|nr:YaaL family protein [Caloramator sp.]